MKKVLVILLLIMTTVGCALFDGELWEEARREREERGEQCYRDYNGTFYCVDKYGNGMY